MIRRSLVLLTVSALALAGCFTPSGGTVEQKRDNILEMRTQALDQLYTANPSLRSRVANAAGYGVFSNVGLHLFVLGTGQGYGVVHDNRSGRDTYMRMAELGAGFGAGVQDFRAIYVFLDRASLETFIERGWEFGADADAALKAGGKGAAAGGQADVGAGGAAASTTGEAQNTSGAAAGAGTGIEIYQLTESGLALQATVAGTKYWKYDDLN
jgi:lipid-binding SYLF domain-containing protein